MVKTGRCILEPTPAVLVVEDQDVSRRALSLLLKLNGYTTAAAGSAEEALRMFRQDRWPAIALVDLDLPGMSGLDLISRLRQLDAGVYAILLTAADDMRVRAALGDITVAYIQKPVNFDHLLALLSQHARAN